MEKVQEMKAFIIEKRSTLSLEDASFAKYGDLFFAIPQSCVKRQYLSALSLGDNDEEKACPSERLGVYKALLDYSHRSFDEAVLFFENIDVVSSCASRYFFRKEREENYRIFGLMGDSISLLNGKLSDSHKLKEFTKCMNIIAKICLKFRDEIRDLLTSRDLGFIQSSRKICEVCVISCHQAEFSVTTWNGIGLVLSVFVRPWDSILFPQESCSTDSPYHFDLAKNKIELSTNKHSSSIAVSPSGLLSIVHGCLQRFELNLDSWRYVKILMEEFLRESSHHKDFYILQVIETLFSKLNQVPESDLVYHLVDHTTMSKFEAQFCRVLEKDPFSNRKLMEKLLVSFFRCAQRHFSFVWLSCESIISNISWKHAFKYIALETIYKNCPQSQNEICKLTVVREIVSYLGHRKLTAAASSLLITILVGNPNIIESVSDALDNACGDENEKALIGKVFAPLAYKGEYFLDILVHIFQRKPRFLMEFLRRLDKRLLKKVQITPDLMKFAVRSTRSGDFSSRIAKLLCLLEVFEFSDSAHGHVENFMSYNSHLSNAAYTLELNSLMSTLKRRNTCLYNTAVAEASRQLYPTGSLLRRLTIVQLLKEESTKNINLNKHYGVLVSSFFDCWKALREIAYEKAAETGMRALSGNLNVFESNIVCELNSIKQKLSCGACYSLALVQQNRWENLEHSHHEEFIFSHIASWQGKAYSAIQRVVATGDVVANCLHGTLMLIRLLMSSKKHRLQYNKDMHSLVVSQSLEICLQVLEYFGKDGLLEESLDEPGNSVFQSGEESSKAIAWCSIKEAADLLKASFSDNLLQIPFNTFRRALQAIVRTMLSSKHNGVISKCQTVLRAIADDCFTTNSQVHVDFLKIILLDMFGSDGVESSEETRTLRRSQGLPFIISALLEAERNQINKSLFRKCMHLINQNLNKNEGIEADSLDKLVINSLNVLRLILSSNILRISLSQYIETFFEIVLRGLRSNKWAVRNSFIMTFARVLCYLIDDNPHNRPCVYDVILKYPFVLKVTTEILREKDQRMHSFPALLLSRLKPVDVPSQKHDEDVVQAFRLCLNLSGSKNILHREKIAEALYNLAGVNPALTIKHIIDKLVEVITGSDMSGRKNSLHTLLCALNRIVPEFPSFSAHHLTHSIQGTIVKAQIDDVEHGNNMLVACVTFTFVETLDKFDLLYLPAAAHFLDLLEKFVSRLAAINGVPSFLVYWKDLLIQCVEGIFSSGNEKQFSSTIRILAEFPFLSSILPLISDECLLHAILSDDFVRSVAIQNCTQSSIAGALRTYYKSSNDCAQFHIDLNSHGHDSKQTNIFWQAKCLLVSDLSLEWSLKSEIIRFIILLWTHDKTFASVSLIGKRLQDWTESDTPVAIRQATTEAICDLDNFHETTYSSHELCGAITALLMDGDVTVRQTMADAVAYHGENFHESIQPEIALEIHFINICRHGTFAGSEMYYFEKLMPCFEEVERFFDKEPECENECTFDREDSNFYAEDVLLYQYIASILRALSADFSHTHEKYLCRSLDLLLGYLTRSEKRIAQTIRLPYIADIWSILYRLLLAGWTIALRFPQMSVRVRETVLTLLKNPILKNVIGPAVQNITLCNFHLPPKEVCFLLSSSFFDEAKIA